MRKSIGINHLVVVVLLLCVSTILAPSTAWSQSYDLTEYLPYRAGVSSEFSPSNGFTLSMSGSGTTEPEFFWLASNPAVTLKLYYSVSDDGLAILHEDGTTAGEPDDTEDYVPDWIVAPRSVTTGLVVASNGSYNGSELGHTWTGTTAGTLTVNGIETLSWFGGTSDVLKVTFVNNWSDSDGDSGTTTQTWWMVRYVGVVKLVYDFAENDSEGGSQSGTFEFDLTSSTLVAPPQILAQPDSLTVVEGAPATFTVVPGGAGPFTYQWRKGGIAITGAEAASYPIASAQLGDAGDYDVQITNPYGSTNSSAATLTVESVPDPANIPDANLEAALRLALSKPTGVITITDLQSLVSFTAIDQGISDLTGLEHAVNLKTLNLSGNIIGSIAPLSTMTAMLNLTLNSNQISDVSPLNGMALIKELFLTDNQIIDAGPLSALTSMKRINLTKNNIIDISPLSSLVNLTHLDAGLNSFVDISSLVSLQKLAILQIPVNKIEDISVLASLPNLIGINLQNNFITDLASVAGRTGFTSFLIAANYLDLSPGSPDQIILDAFVTAGTTVFSAPQFAVPVTMITSPSTPVGGTLHLEWNSQVGFTYQVLMSNDLVNWTIVEGTLVSGDGNTQSADVAIPSEGTLFFQIDVGLD